MVVAQAVDGLGLFSSELLSIYSHWVLLLNNV